ncbi:unnamed protein product [Clavelina lepadiformis]|uniref:Major facilitator superfamily (MFS) profile domain-containing protein n=1 Tax=Clavelina lepadiformis TaxID=159417 RepID=A0ABP0G599_CLALP
MNNEKCSSLDKEPIASYRTYKKRWLVLCVVAVLNLSGGMVWITFTPVAYKAVAFYETDLGTINWLALLFNVCGIVFGVVATYELERFGLRPALYLSAGLTFVGAALRIASVAEDLNSTEKLVVLFAGQALVAVGQPFSMYAPAKTAAVWFPEDERAIANTIGAVANPIGVVLAGLISPLFVDYNSGDFYVLNLLITMACPAALGALMTLLIVTSGEPSIPPSAGGKKTPEYFGHGLKKLFKNKNYIILLLTVGAGIGLYGTFATLLEQLLCPFGYTDTMAGICSAVLTGFGVVGAAIVGVYCDRTKQFSSSIKFCYIAVTIGTIVFSCVFHINIGYLILIVVGGCGLFSFGIYPIGVELAVECTYPVGVATSSGLIMISGQLQSIILVLVLQLIGRPMSAEEVIKYDSQCHQSQNAESATTTAEYSTSSVANLLTTGADGGGDVTYDLSLSIYVCTAYMGLMALTLLLFFRPKYLRMEAERSNDLNSDSSESVMPPAYINKDSELSHL